MARLTIRPLLAAFFKPLKRILPRTLFGRSLMIMVTPVLLLQIIVSFIFFDRHLTSMSERLASAVAGEVDMVVTQLEHAKTKKQTEAIISDASRSLELLVSIEPPGRKLKVVPMRPSSWYSVEQTLRNALEQKLHRPFIARAYDSNKWYEITVQSKRGVIRILCREKRMFSTTTYIFIIWLLGSSFVLFAIAIIFMRNQIRPIRRLALAAERFGKGQDVTSFKPEGASEVRQAAHAFLEMRDRIRRQIEQRTAMLAGVSHDLRTPLTRMKLQLEMLGDTPDIADLRHDIQEMEQMIEGYLAFARGEGGELSERTNLKTMLQRIAAKEKRQGGDIHENYEGDLFVKVRAQSVERAIGNLISNACKYAPHVWISAYMQSEMIEVAIDDDGAGIPQDLREEVFKPFFRVEGSRNPRTGGIGLGLSIARDIIHSHGGELFLEDSNRGGLRVVVRLPV